VLSDTNGDGEADDSRVFLDNLQRLTSVQVGHGGVWLLCPPQLLFVPDGDADGRPDGPCRVVLEGFQVPMESHHNFANGLKWGPDGWLYGRCGASAFTRVRLPGQTEAESVPLAGGIWRFHPKRKVFEPLCHGTTNPWGHDWDARGECFFVNTVNGHLWHLIPGGHCRRPHTVSPNPMVFEPLEMIADHWHFDTGKGWTSSRDGGGGSDRLGGGHAHSGALIYQGDQWPRAFRGKLLTLNFHGRRVNVESLEPVQSGFLGRHQPDILQSADPFFRGIDLLEGPDGSVLILDWSDTGECHDATGVHRTSGRIYRVSGPNKAKPTTGGLVAEALGAKGAWKARKAWIELSNQEKPPTIDPHFLGKESAPTVRLNALWTMHQLGQTNQELLVKLLSDTDEMVRVWAIRLLLDHHPLDTVEGNARAEGVPVAPEVLNSLKELALNDSSARVRLTLASALGRLPIQNRATLAKALLQRGEDASDPNIPKLVWYGLIPVARQCPDLLPELAIASRFPATREWIARGLAMHLHNQPGPTDRLLALALKAPEKDRLDVLRGLSAGLAGVRKIPKPGAWDSFQESLAKTGHQEAIRALEVVFGNGRALEELRALALDPKGDMASRKRALATWMEANPADLQAVCGQLLGVRSLNAVAVEGLVRTDAPDLGVKITAQFASFYPIDRPGVVTALASRPRMAMALLEAVGAGKIPKDLLTPAVARQLAAVATTSNDKALQAKLETVWGTLRQTPEDKQAKIRRIREKATPEALGRADAKLGRDLFQKSCATCHRLFGEGQDIGPDLTGSGRKDLDYLLTNLVDPGAVLAAEYRLSVVEMKDGRVLTGVVQSKVGAAVVLQTDKVKLVLPKESVEAIQVTDQSL
ncbi:MAG: PVC-type heme-binding CxxCH protein, partial [Gemmataceae bacterium]